MAKIGQNFYHILREEVQIILKIDIIATLLKIKNIKKFLRKFNLTINNNQKMIAKIMKISKFNNEELYFNLIIN